MNKVALFGGIGLGVGIMYFLDPAMGRRRRALVRDKAVWLWNKSGRVVGATSRDMANRARGLVAEFQPGQSGDVDDRVLEERVRSAMGRVVSHPSAISVMAEGGRVTLTGDILREEADDLLSCVSNVPGVFAAVNSLNVHESADNVPSLQGEGRRARSTGYGRWSPATIAFTAGGSIAAFYAIRAGLKKPEPLSRWRRMVRPMATLWRSISQISMPRVDYNPADWSSAARLIAGVTGGALTYYTIRMSRRRRPVSRWRRVISSMPRVDKIVTAETWRRVPSMVQGFPWIH